MDILMVDNAQTMRSPILLKAILVCTAL